MLFQSKLVQVLAVLSEKEKALFNKFISSDFVTENDKLPLLYRYIVENRLWEEKEEDDKQQVFDYLYPSKDYNDAALRKLMSELLQKLEMFIAYQDLQVDPYKVRKQVLNFYRANNLHKHFFHHFRVLEKDLLNIEGSSADYYLLQHDLFHEFNEMVNSELNRTQTRRLQEQADSLDLFYILKKLQSSNTIFSHQQISSAEYKLDFLEGIIHVLEESDYLNIPIVNMYYTVLKINMRQDDEMFFQKLEQLLQENFDKISPNYGNELYAYAFNYCVQQINTGKLDYLQNLFQLYQQGLGNGIMVEEGFISPWNYKNVVTLGLRLKEYDWVYEFIHDYKKKIGGSEPKNAYTFNLARYYFSIQKYKKVLELLQMVEYSDVFYKLDSKALLLKSYYETEEIDALFSLTESFKQLLRRRKLISDRHRTNYLNLIRLLKRLIKINPRDKKKLKDLRETIDKTDQIADKNWLLEKVDELYTPRK